MNAQLRRAAKACLFSTVAGMGLVPGGTVSAQTAGRIHHADAIEEFETDAPTAPSLGRSFSVQSRNERQFSADHKISGGLKPAVRPKLRRANVPQQSKAHTETTTRSAGTITSAPRPIADPPEGIEQIAALQGRTKLRPQPAVPAVTQPPSSESEVQRQVRELYHKNGREMPDFKLDDYQAPQTATPPFSGTARGAGGTPATGSRFALKSSKPNFLERMFHFGRAKPKPSPAMPPLQSGSSTTPGRSNAAVGGTSLHPARSLPAFRPAPALPAGPGSLAQRPQSAAVMREPAPLGPATTFPDLLSQGSPTAQPRLESQPLMDESGMRDDHESLDLSGDQTASTPTRTPSVVSNPATQGSAGSPYSGRTINPNETEQDIARDDDDHTVPTPDEQAEAAVAGRSQPSPATDTTPPFELPQTGAGAADDDEEDEDDWSDLDDDAKAPTRATRGGKTLSIPQDDDTTSNPSPSEKKNARTAASTNKCFKGYCPVMLKDERKLIEARPEFESVYRGKIYLFSSLAARQAFDESPQKYSPAGDGRDVVQLAGGEDASEGTLEHAAWYRGRLYLFSSSETRAVFVETPARFSIND
ncbi:MAG: hypothetical protein EXS05_20090 [Planctomycetaceae bacterium]|nr:hypothetical protein [Planctomycetaceae bacterium]